MVYKRDMADWEKEEGKGNVASADGVPRFKVTDADKRLKTEAWKRWQQGNPNYYYAPGKGKA